MNTKSSIKASSLILLLVTSLTPGFAIAADEMTDPSKAPNSSNSIELPVTPAEIPAEPSTSTEAATPTEMQIGNDSSNPSSSQTDLQTTKGSGDGQMSNSQVSNEWMKPLAAEFAKLDKTGNGLILPNEATRGKAFNKKTFAKADADKDGSIDQNEYISFKGGDTSELMATSTPQNNTASNDAAINKVSDSNLFAANATDMQMTENTSGTKDSNETNMGQDNATTGANDTNPERPLGAVVDDTMITTKAKAQILATQDLKTLDISVKTVNGEVTLTGMAKTQAAKMKAEDVVKNIAGVKTVVNNLQVKG